MISPNQPGWFVAALDAISQFRATKEPLKNIAKRIAEKRRLGPRERTKMSDAVFAWARVASDSSTKGRASFREFDEAILRKWLEGETGETRFPAWFVASLENAYGDRSPALLEALHRRAGPSLAVDIRKSSVAAVCAALDAAQVSYARWAHFDEAICILEQRFRLEKLPQDIQRCVWLMDPASQLVAQAAVPPSGVKILDACAGAGGKTQFLLSRGAKVIAMDVSKRRLDNAKIRCRGETVTFEVGDATNPPFKPGSLEHILLDAPCSGTGTVRRAPDLLLRLTQEQVQKYVELQRSMLVSLCTLLKQGGRLVYATCSILPKENQEQVAWALSALPVKCISERQLLPSQDDSDGFFVAVLEKSGEDNACP